MTSVPSENQNGEESTPVVTLSQENPPSQVHSTTPKPLMVYGVTDTQLRSFAEMIDAEAAVNFSVKLAGEYIKIFPETHWDKYEISKVLDRKNIQYYIVPDNPRVQKFVLGRLEADQAEVEDALKDLGYEVIHVVRMKSRRDKRLLPLFLVTLVWSESAKNILKLSSLFRVRVKVEPYRPPKKATQCYRCNKFFHIAKYCKIKPACCICSQEHETRDCPRKVMPATERPPPVCVNCNEAHTSSYRGCKNFPSRPSYAQATAKNIPKKRTPPKREEKKPALNRPVINQKNSIDNGASQLYTPEELDNAGSDLVAIIAGLRKELQVNSLSDLLITLQDSLKVISSEKDLLTKRLAFMDCLLKITPSPKLPEQSTAQDGR